MITTASCVQKGVYIFPPLFLVSVLVESRLMDLFFSSLDRTGNSNDVAPGNSYHPDVMGLGGKSCT
jgi:hypothetical protein